MNGDEQIWTRFRLLEASAPTDREILERLAIALDDGELSTDDRRRAAGYLRRLAESKSALATLNRAGRGRPVGAGVNLFLIAVDYLARERMKRWTPGKLRQDTARDWAVSEDTVMRSLREQRVGAELQISGLHGVGTREPTELDAIVGSLKDYRTRHHIRRGNKSR